MSKSRSGYYYPLVLLALLTFSEFAECVDRSKFKTCDQSSFCKRNRAIATNPDAQTVYSLSDVRKVGNSKITAKLHNPFLKEKSLQFEMRALQNSMVQMRISEDDPRRYTGAEEVLLPSIQEASLTEKESTSSRYSFTIGNNVTVHVGLSPFTLEILVDNEVVMSGNKKGWLNFEHLRDGKDNDIIPKEVVSPDASKPDTWDDEADGPWEAPKVPNPALEGRWDESFQGHQDSKPRGPTSVGMDLTFSGTKHVYGIPEHASNLALPVTMKDGTPVTDPYRLYNLDVFEYELHNPMALYGSVPFMLSHSARRTNGIFWLNAAETWIDVAESTDSSTGESQMDTHWMSESGIINVFFLLGPGPHQVFQQYAQLTGTTALPLMASIGYHQCKWNYKDEKEVAEVDSGFDTHNIPYDFIWLDIEHTDEKKYFTWDSNHFPHPKEMQQKIAGKGRKMVTIVDPHIKRDSNYAVHTLAQSSDLYVKVHDNSKEYDGHCWPGSSSWIDYMDPVARSWWSDRFSYYNYGGSTDALFTWNDMNEPSVFSGPEVTMHKDLLHNRGKFEHRDVHNMYGMYMHEATANGLVKRNAGENVRPFVLSRAFFAGTQRHGAIWTGDNAAKWDHLAIAQPMLLSLGLTGIAFSGADVGGFFGNPEPELLTRWYQAGAFQPFFRGHAHLDSKRREPWLFGEPHLNIIRTSIRTRYSFLPFWYTLFYQNSVTGAPLIRPLWVEYPTDLNTFSEQDQFLVGTDLLVKPVTAPGQLLTEVYLPGDQPWYDHVTAQKYQAPAKISMETPLEKIPVFQRGGSIIPKKERVRRSSSQMANDPYTLVVALDTKGDAKGELYVDDGHSFDYKKGQYLRRQFQFSANKLSSAALGGSFVPINTVEKIVVVGFAQTPVKILLQTGGKQTELTFTYDARQQKLVVRKPDVSIADDWTISVAV